MPNDAASVLYNKFGDCKDKATLMSALLAAKGIASEQALINLGNAYTLPEPPTMVALNHVILYPTSMTIRPRISPHSACWCGVASPRRQPDEWLPCGGTAPRSRARYSMRDLQ